MSDRHGVLSRRELAGYGAGDFASNLYFGFFGTFLLYFYTDVVGLSATLVAGFFLVTKVVDAVTDPMMGIIADRTHTRWGRYRPYLLWMAVPFALSGPVIFLLPDGPTAMQVTYAIITYSLMMLAYTAINVPYSALLGVISPDAGQRARASKYRFLGAVGASLLVAAFTRELVAILGQGDEARGFVLTVSLYAFVALIMFFACFSLTRERIEPVVQPLQIRKDIANLFALKPWRVMGLIALFAIVGISARGSVTIHFFKYVASGAEVGFGFDDPTAFFLAGTELLTFAGVIASGPLTKRFAKKQLMVRTAIVQAVMLALFYVTPSDRFWLLMGSSGVFSFAFGIQLVLLFAMYTDIAEYAEYKTGRQMTGLVLASMLFILKLCGSLGTAFAAWLMGVTGFEANTDLSQGAIDGLRAAFTLISLGCVIGLAVAASRYPLNRARVAEIETELARKRASADQLAPA